MKKDFTYICLFDDASTQAIRDIQEKLNQEIGYSEYADQWVPHVTISFGNFLSEAEIEEVKKECEIIAKQTTPFYIEFSHVAITKREIQGQQFYSLRLKVKSNPELEDLSARIINLAKKYEIPFDVFTNDHYHVGMGRHARPDLDEEKVKAIIDFDNLPKPLITSFSLFYSMANVPVPEKAIEAARFTFG